MAEPVSFLAHLHALVTRADPAVCCWCTVSVKNSIRTIDDAICILDRDRFMELYAGKLSKTFTSFVKQLNLYGFAKVRATNSNSNRNRAAPPALVYTNPNFRRRGYANLPKKNRKKKTTTTTTTTATVTAISYESDATVEWIPAEVEVEVAADAATACITSISSRMSVDFFEGNGDAGEDDAESCSPFFALKRARDDFTWDNAVNVNIDGDRAQKRQLKPTCFEDESDYATDHLLSPHCPL